MPFPKNKIHFITNIGTCPRETTITDENTGIISTKIEDCNKSLPPSEYFEIQNQIKAGVTLNEVNTNILGSNINTEALTEAIKTTTKTKSTKSTKSNEVNTNEN